MTTSKSNPNRDNVVPFPGSELPDIPFATVCSNGVRVSGSRNAVWLCPAYAGAADCMVYVKPALNPRQIVAELLCAQVAIAMGLPCPQPFLIGVGPHHVGEPRGRARLTYGCQQVGGRSTAKVIRDLDLVFEALQKAKAHEGVSVLDEWAANSVRHERDLIFDLRSTVWIIDHEAALPRGVNPDEALTNWLADRLRDRTAPDKRAEVLAALRKRAARTRALRLGDPPAGLEKLDGGPETWREVVEFLHARLHQLDRLLSQRLLPSQAYLPLEPTQPLTAREPAGPAQL